MTVAGIARSIADVEEPEAGRSLAAGDRLGLNSWITLDA